MSFNLSQNPPKSPTSPAETDLAGEQPPPVNRWSQNLVAWITRWSLRMTGCYLGLIIAIAATQLPKRSTDSQATEHIPPQTLSQDGGNDPATQRGLDQVPLFTPSEPAAVR